MRATLDSGRRGTPTRRRTGPSPQAWAAAAGWATSRPACPVAAGKRRRAPVGWLAVVASDRPTRAAARMSVATLASRGVGFVKVWVIAAVLGATYLGNTYQASSSVSNVLFELIAAGALSAVLVPTFVDLFRADDDAEAERLASGVLGLALVGDGGGLGRRASCSRRRSPGCSRAARRTPQVESQQVALSTFFLRLLHPAGPALRDRHGGHRGALRQAPLRDRRGGADRQHRGARHPRWRVPDHARRRRPTSTSPPRRSSSSRSVGTLGVVGFVGVPTVGAVALRVPPAGHARHGRPQAAAIAVALGVGRAADPTSPCSSAPRW